MTPIEQSIWPEAFEPVRKTFIARRERLQRAALKHPALIAYFNTRHFHVTVFFPKSPSQTGFLHAEARLNYGASFTADFE